MDRDRTPPPPERREHDGHRAAEPLAPETERHPAPGVKHAPEPDAENLMPAEHEPGTL